jgi:hypothetical protein
MTLFLIPSYAMTWDEFEASLAKDNPPAGLSKPLQALWQDGKGDWTRAHEIAQSVPDWKGAWVHAYLHRKEGDLSNASYWYSRAGRPRSKASLEEEWEEIALALLD